MSGGGSANFFLGARLDYDREKVQSLQANSRCMLSGANRDRPVIVGWSTALRGQVINESLGQLPKRAWPRGPALKNLSPPKVELAQFGVLRIDARKFARMWRL